MSLPASNPKNLSLVARKHEPFDDAGNPCTRRVRLLRAVALAGLLVFLVAGAWQAYRLNVSGILGLDWTEFGRTVGVTLGSIGCLALLGLSLRWSRQAHEQHAAALRNETVFIRSILEASPDAILTVDINGIIQSHNAAANTLFGYEPDQLNGQKISRIIPQRHFLHDLSTLGRGTFLSLGQRKNFLTFPVEVAVSETEANGRRLFIVMVRDASERRASQETLHHIWLSVSSTTGEAFVRSLLQQLSQLLQNDYAFVLETDIDPASGLCSLMIAERGRIRSQSDHALAGTLFAEALKAGLTIIPKGVRERYPQDEILRSLEAESFIGTPLQDATGRTVGLIGLIGRSPNESIGVTKQTLQMFAARAAAEIARKQEAEVLISEKERLHDDYTTAERERKRYEEDLAAEQELLAVTLRSIREGCVTADNRGRVIMLNPVAEELLGWTQPEAAGRTLGEVLHLVTRRKKEPVNADGVLDDPELFSQPMILTSRQGTERLVEASAAPIRNRDDRKLGMVIVLRDVTEKIRIEDERHRAEKLESLGVAAGGIAHDFNNLLTAIIGNLSLALMEAPPSTRERLEASKKASLRAQDLAKQLLTFAKGGAPVKRTASMRQLLLDTVRFSLSGGNIRSEFCIPEDLWYADVDEGQISQVITNLTVNAVQAMANGGTLHVGGKNLLVEPGSPATRPPHALKPGRYVRITVRDEGIGMPEEILKKIFDPYFTTKPNGSGLGLATSYSIIKNHGGIIRVESQPGAGTTFTIDLPASDRVAVPEEAPAPQKPLPRKKGKILVLDDEEVICELVASALAPAGFTVVPTYQAEETVRLYREALEAGEPFDLVIMDLTIPGGMGGREAIRQLKEIDPAVKGIVSSGYGHDPIMNRYAEYGFIGVIAKPYDIAQLERVVSEAIAG